MSRTRRIITNEECQRFNSLRTLYHGQTLKYLDISKLFAVEFGWKSYTLVSSLVGKLFIKVERGKYVFPKDPIYIGKLQNIFDELAKQRKHSYEEKKKASEVVIINPISEAIKLLKENGYKVIKQKFDLEAALQNPGKQVSEFITIEEF